MPNIPQAGLSVFTIPENPKPSQRLRTRFNDTARELGIGLSWRRDKKNPLAIDARELKVDPQFVKKYGVTKINPVPSRFNKTLVQDVMAVLNTIEGQRLELVAQSRASLDWKDWTSDLSNLNPAEQEAVRLFKKEAKPAVDRVYARQDMPEAYGLLTYMEQNGDDDSQFLFARFHTDTCAGFYSRFFGDACSLFPYYPDAPVYNGMISAEITQEEFEKMVETLPKDHENLRPSTALEKNDGAITAIPWPLYPDVREDHLALAQIFEKIAALNIEGTTLHPKVKDQLQKWARYFRTGDFSDEAAAVQATIDAGESESLLRIHVGPSESYWNDQIKMAYLLQVGVKDPQIQTQMQTGAENLQQIEDSLADVAGYTPRQLSSRGGFADPMYQVVVGGFLDGFPIREPLGNNFPNYTYPGVEGSNRFILLDGLVFATQQLEGVFPQIFADEIDFGAQGMFAHTSRFVVGHESGHMVGPQRDHITPSGERMATVFGEFWSNADEPKSDVTAIQDFKLDYEKDKLSRDEFEKYVLAYASLNLSNRYKGKRAFLESLEAGKPLPQHYYGYMIEAGYYFKVGAYELRQDASGNPKIFVDVDKLIAAQEDFWKRKIITFEAQGDVGGFLTWGNDLIQYIPDEADTLILSQNAKNRMFFVVRHLP